MKLKRLAVGVITLVSAVTSARADALLTPVDGGVLVSSGQGFVRTTKAATLKVGDRAMVAQGNRGKITFPDGCAVDLRPGAVQIVGPVSPCAQAQGFVGGGDCLHARTPEQRQALGCDAIGYATAAAVIGLGAAAAAISLSESDAGAGSSP